MIRLFCALSPRGRKPGFVLPLTFLLWAQSAVISAGPLLDLQIESGRVFGHSIGDLVREEIHFRLKHPDNLQKSALPQPGVLAKGLDLRKIEVHENRLENTTAYTITVEYQLFPALKKTEMLKIPGLPLRIIRDGRILSESTPETVLSVHPLLPEGTPDNQVRLRAAYAPAPIRLENHWRRLAMLASFVVAGFSYLAWRRGIFPFAWDRSGFASARRQIAKWKNADANSPQYRKALRLVHQALNQTAGETLFASGMERFFRRHPAFEPMREKTRIFFDLSERVFFARTQAQNQNAFSIRWLEQLCREYHAIERQA